MAPTSKSMSQSHPAQKKSKQSSGRAKTVKLEGNVAPASSLSMKRLDPLTAFSNHLTLTPTPPSATAVSSSRVTSKKRKDKGKSKENVKDSSTPEFLGMETTDDALWIDIYAPTKEAELAVHIRKVEHVRGWLNEAFEGGPSGKLKQYRRILVLTGPAGTGKTATIQVLAKEMDFDILEWKSAMGEVQYVNPDSDDVYSEFNQDYENLFSKFEAFLTRAAQCQDIFEDSSSSAPLHPKKRRVILLEDLPNILHQKTQAQVQEALEDFVHSSLSNPPVPLIIIISDSGLRGEVGDESSIGWGRNKLQVVDIRTVIPKNLLGGPYVTEIRFNPIATTLMRKALQSMLNTHSISISGFTTVVPSKEVLDIIIESSNGDIRSAIMALQFACVVELPGRKRKNGQQASSIVLEAVTRREQSLALFHLLGKVLYNKRKDDPPNPSASAKDQQKERDIDTKLRDAISLPLHLQHHERRTSRVNVDQIYADSPVDSSLFALYIHQNYTQFCNDIEEIEEISNWLSWIDSSGGDAWYQANPHQFHLLTLGTLHSLPSPVPRRSQKYFKPEFFAYLQKQKEAQDGVQVTLDWLTENEMQNSNSGRPGGFGKNEVVQELGGVLKAYDVFPDKMTKSKPPSMHKLFSQMNFSHGGTISRPEQLGEADVETNSAHAQDADNVVISKRTNEQAGGWLESDDIDEFE